MGRDVRPRPRPNVRTILRLVLGQARETRRVVASVGAAAMLQFLPRAADPHLASLIHRTFVTTRLENVDKAEGRMEALLGSRDDAVEGQYRQTAIDYWRMRVEVRLERARGLLPRTSPPRTTITGLENLEAALDRGNGAILWRMMFTAADPINAALLNAGYPITHLSYSNHMQADRSWWANRVIGPVQRRSEVRWLGRRVIIGRGLGYLLTLRQELADNGVVSMVGDLSRARHTVVAKIGNGRYRLATGAPSLSYATGAALLPCLAVREGPCRYRVIIGADLAPRDVVRKAEYRQKAVTSFAQDVEANLRRHTSSANWWGHHY